MHDCLGTGSLFLSRGSLWSTRGSSWSSRGSSWSTRGSSWSSRGSSWSSRGSSWSSKGSSWMSRGSFGSAERLIYPCPCCHYNFSFLSGVSLRFSISVHRVTTIINFCQGGHYNFPFLSRGSQWFFGWSLWTIMRRESSIMSSVQDEVSSK